MLVGPLTDLVRDTQGYHPVFAVLMLVAVVSHALGAWFKRRPLQARMMQQPPWGGGAYLLFLTLCVMHLGLFIACTSLALDVLEAPPFIIPWLLFTLGVAPTFLAIYALLPLRNPVPNEPSRLARTERVADGLLCLSAVLIFVWWEAVFVESVAGRGQNYFMDALLVLLMCVPFAMFYLAPRLLYLAEDFRDKKTWLRLVLVVMPLAWRLVAG